MKTNNARFEVPASVKITKAKFGIGAVVAGALCL